MAEPHPASASARPWRTQGADVFSAGAMVADCRVQGVNDGIANAAFICRAVNHHDALVAALREFCMAFSTYEHSFDIARGPWELRQADTKARAVLAALEAEK